MLLGPEVLVRGNHSNPLAGRISRLARKGSRSHLVRALLDRDKVLRLDKVLIPGKADSHLGLVPVHSRQAGHSHQAPTPHPSNPALTPDRSSLGRTQDRSVLALVPQVRVGHSSLVLVRRRSREVLGLHLVRGHLGLRILGRRQGRGSRLGLIDQEDLEGRQGECRRMGCQTGRRGRRLWVEALVAPLDREALVDRADLERREMGCRSYSSSRCEIRIGERVDGKMDDRLVWFPDLEDLVGCDLG